MAITSYDDGDRVRLGNHSGNAATAPFTTVGGVATDPTDVALTVKARIRGMDWSLEDAAAAVAKA